MADSTLFESFLAGSLSKQEMSAFEARRVSDAAFESAFQEYTKTQVALDLLQEADVMSVIDIIKLEEKAAGEGKQFKWLVLGVAAIIALAIVIGSLFNQKGDAQIRNTEQLIAEFYKTPMLGGIRSLEVFSFKKIDSTIKAAHALMHSKEYSKAAEKFSKIIELTDGKVQARAEWYLALCLLDSDLDRSTVLLQQITQDTIHPRYTEAQALLKKITLSSKEF